MSSSKRFLLIFFVLTVAHVGALGVHATTPISSCQLITQPGEYVLVQDLIFTQETPDVTCLRIMASDVTIDGNGYMILNDGVNPSQYDIYGIQSGNYDALRPRITLQNIHIKGFDTGIIMTQNDDTILTDVLVEDNDFCGIGVGGSERVRINNVIVRNNDFCGISFLSTHRSNISNLQVLDNSFLGILFKESSHNVVEHFLVKTSATGIEIVGGSPNNKLYDGRIEDFSDNGVYGGGPIHFYNVVTHTENPFAYHLYAGGQMNLHDSVISRYYLWNSPLTKVFTNTTGFGFIEILDPVAATGNNLSEDLKISYNRAHIEPTRFTTGARIQLLQVPGGSSLTRNDVLCPEPDCTILMTQPLEFLVQESGTYAVAGSLCPADINNNGVADVQDIFAFLTVWFAGGTGADFNNDGAVTVADIFAFLSAWFAGC